MAKRNDRTTSPPPNSYRTGPNEQGFFGLFGGRFVAETGLDPGTLRSRMHDSDTLAAVLAHVLADESALLAFAANAGLRPEDVARAEAELGGGGPWESA